jgi:hypothetical protein
MATIPFQTSIDAFPQEPQDFQYILPAPQEFPQKDVQEEVIIEEIIVDDTPESANVYQNEVETATVFKNVFEN